MPGINYTSVYNHSRSTRSISLYCDAMIHKKIIPFLFEKHLLIKIVPHTDLF